MRESVLTTNDLIWPMFVAEGRRGPVPSMPGVDRLPVDDVVREVERAAKLTIPCIALFPYTDPTLRDEAGSEALNPDNLVCRAIRAIKKAVPEVGVLCDVALDPYTSHGHDGLLRDGVILNDETVSVLVKQALVQAEAGCDVIAPSDMVYSFFDPKESARSLGTYMILDHIERARKINLPYVYLGYWVRGSGKMDYKARFLPQERLLPDGWTRFDA